MYITYSESQDVQPQWANPSALHIFRGTVYVDGSEAIVRWYKEFSTAAWAAVVMSDDHGNTVDVDRPDLWDDSIQRESESDEQDEDCLCSNASNPHHKCPAWCVDNMGCNGKCKRKSNKKEQRKQEPVTKPRQPLSGPLNGPAQTVPRAELEAIAQTLEKGIGPSVIYTDHRNHARACEKGRGYCTRPRGRRVDMWRFIWKRIWEIKRQGGTVEIK